MRALSGLAGSVAPSGPPCLFPFGCGGIGLLPEDIAYIALAMISRPCYICVEDISSVDPVTCRNTAGDVLSLFAPAPSRSRVNSFAALRAL